jgi:hypothetical protein
MVLVPEPMAAVGLGVTVSLYITTNKAVMNRNREMIKIINAPSI